MNKNKKVFFLVSSIILFAFVMLFLSQVSSYKINDLIKAFLVITPLLLMASITFYISLKELLK